MSRRRRRCPLSLTLSHQMETNILRRWKKWEPLLLADLKSHTISQDALILVMVAYKQVHRDAIETCLHLGLRFDGQINKHNLDDPRITDATRGERIAKFKKSQARRPGKLSRKFGGLSYRKPGLKPILPGDI